MHLSFANVLKTFVDYGGKNMPGWIFDACVR